MSYPNSPNQPPWTPPGGQPAGGMPPQGGGMPPQGMAYAPPPQYGAPRKRRTWMIPVAGALGVALMASGVWAANYAMDDLFGGPQPATVAPASSIMFAELDLKPSGSQLADYAQFVDKLPDEVKDEIDPEADPAEPIFDETFLHDTDLTYEEDIEPWFGDRFGVAAWPAEDEEAAASGDGEAFVALLAADDEDAADEALNEMSNSDQWKDSLYWDFRDGFAVLTDSNAALDEHQSLTDEGTLDGEDDYANDMTDLGSDAVARGWFDLEGLSELTSDGGGSSSTDPYAEPSDPFGGSSEEPYGDPHTQPPLGGGFTTGPENASGRMAMALQVESDHLELRGNLIEAEIDGVSMGDYEVEEPGLDMLGELPNDTVMAAGGGQIDEVLSQAYEDDPDAFSDLEDAMSQFGAAPPEGFTDVLGSRTAFGLTDFGGTLETSSMSSDPSFQYRATGADPEVLEDMLSGAGTGYGSSPGVDSDGDTAVVSYGSTGTGQLADDEVYQQTMEGMEGSAAGFYLDARAFAEETGEAHDPEQYGGVGGSVALDGDDASYQMRWSPTG